MGKDWDNDWDNDDGEGSWRGGKPNPFGFGFSFFNHTYKKMAETKNPTPINATKEEIGWMRYCANEDAQELSSEFVLQSTAPEKLKKIKQQTYSDILKIISIDLGGNVA